MATTAEHLKSQVTLLKSKGVALTVFLPPGIHAHLKDLADQNERSLSGEIRWVLKRYSEYPESLNE